MSLQLSQCVHQCATNEQSSDSTCNSRRPTTICASHKRKRSLPAYPELPGSGPNSTTWNWRKIRSRACQLQAAQASAGTSMEECKRPNMRRWCHQPAVQDVWWWWNSLKVHSWILTRVRFRSHKKTYMHACIHTYIHINIHWNTEIHTCMHTCMHACMHACKHGNTCIPHATRPRAQNQRTLNLFNKLDHVVGLCVCLSLMCMQGSRFCGGPTAFWCVSCTVYSDVVLYVHPDVYSVCVCRDLDSVEDSVRAYYESRGTKVLQDSDPNTTDLQKCIELLLRLDLPINQVHTHTHTPICWYMHGTYIHTLICWYMHITPPAAGFAYQSGTYIHTHTHTHTHTLIWWYMHGTYIYTLICWYMHIYTHTLIY